MGNRSPHGVLGCGMPLKCLSKGQACLTDGLKGSFRLLCLICTVDIRSPVVKERVKSSSSRRMIFMSCSQAGLKKKLGHFPGEKVEKGHVRQQKKLG